ncbi:MAG: hypothetical protein ACYC7D_00385 [Nitrososphaerales archaeon]
MAIEEISSVNGPCIEISGETASDIALFCSVARANGSNLSLKEIIQLTSLKITEEELSHAWPRNRALSEAYEIDSGIVYGKRQNRDRAADKGEQSERTNRAHFNILYAKRFSDFTRNVNSLVISVSGSTSYLSVSREDDLDFFCITKKDTMWFFLCKALILARLFRLSDSRAPWLCLSYVMDEGYAESEFSMPQGGLFARDAISTIVVQGEKYYNSLLRRCAWMEEYFPRMYRARTSVVQSDRILNSNSSAFSKVVNFSLYLVAGSYIRLKSHMLNRKFASSGEKTRLFKLRIGKDHCIYESISYLELRKMYSMLERSKRSATPTREYPQKER